MRISVIGGGYVGLVTSTCFAELGHQVNMIEIEEEKVEAINSGRTLVNEKGLEELLSRHAGRNLSATTGYEDIPRSDVSFICVGTPAGHNGEADLSMIEAVSHSIGKALQDLERYHAVVVRSTVPPKTTEGLIIPTVISGSGLSKEEVGFAVNPEFLREGSAVQDFMHPDRIVIGRLEKRAGDQVEAVYRGIDAPILWTGLSTAEMIKYTSNAFLATKISFSNEMGNICKLLGIDVYEVMRGVGMDHRIGPHFLNAGAGFGGSCLPKDLAALINLAESLGENPTMLKSIIEVNERQPRRMIELLERRIGDLSGKRVAVIGLAFKNGTDDIREARAIPVIKELKRKGAEVTAYDPLAIPVMRKLIPDIKYCESSAEALKGSDACLVMTEWPEFSKLDREFDLMRSRVIIEGRRILSCSDREGICW